MLLGPAKEAGWQGGILFDDAVRDGMRLDSEAGRSKARSLGDLPYLAAPILPMLIDPLIAAWAVRGDGKTAVNLELMALEAFSYAGFASFLSTRVSRRERPDSAECRRQHPDGEGCAVDTESFFSGHTTIAATSAGLVCANHSRLPLWGNPVADAAACVLSTTAALASGTSRIEALRSAQQEPDQALEAQRHGSRIAEALVRLFARQRRDVQAHRLVGLAVVGRRGG